MAEIEKLIKEDYQKNLDPVNYKKFKLDGFKREKSDNNYTFWFDCLNDFFSSGKARGERLLELGSGPTVHNVATACKYFRHVVLSEFVESNCVALRKWLKKDGDIFDWTIFLQGVAKAEGRSDLGAACKEIESRIRASVKAVVHADVLQDEVIPPEYSSVPFDVVLTVLTFEAAAADLDSYHHILGRANRLLRPGGHLVMIGVIMCSYWQVGSNRFHCLELSEKDIQEGLEGSGFGEIEWKVREFPDEDLPFNCTKVYFLSCKKLKEA